MEDPLHVNQITSELLAVAEAIIKCLPITTKNKYELIKQHLIKTHEKSQVKDIPNRDSKPPHISTHVQTSNEDFSSSSILQIQKCMDDIRSLLPSSISCSSDSLLETERDSHSDDLSFHIKKLSFLSITQITQLIERNAHLESVLKLTTDRHVSEIECLQSKHHSITIQQSNELSSTKQSLKEEKLKTSRLSEQLKRITMALEGDPSHSQSTEQTASSHLHSESISISKQLVTLKSSLASLHIRALQERAAADRDRRRYRASIAGLLSAHRREIGRVGEQLIGEKTRTRQLRDALERTSVDNLSASGLY
eukprot:gnl/Dysnectes_brevis/4411_a5912_646.p1 GENE.gnl/Dysnectes_brevis/4411_a5912_646~~gnl/Dysnectes_brevis/4411_a5912_646.p1  ORF type:complete len:328 (+),score=-9.39 gnl/Dysnectes_brevis/4411_a5912_646:60-986(+)